MAFSANNFSFGQFIPVTGPNVGFLGNVSRGGNQRTIRSRPVLNTTASGILAFGAGAVELSYATSGAQPGGAYQSLADFLATATNAANLQQYWAGIAVRNVKTMYQYTALNQSTNTTTATALATQVTPGSTSFTSGTVVGTILAGQYVEGYGIAAGTVVTSVSGSTVNISLGTLYALSSSAVTFVNPSTESYTGSYAAGQEADVLLVGSTTVQITNGTPQNNYPVYIRTVANATIAGTAVGDFEAAADSATTAITIGTTIGSTTVTTSAGTGLAPGQYVTSTYFPSNTYIVSGATTSWVFSQPALATVASGAAMTTYNTGLLGTASDPWLRFSTGQIDSNGVCEVTILRRYAA